MTCKVKYLRRAVDRMTPASFPWQFQQQQQPDMRDRTAGGLASLHGSPLTAPCRFHQAPTRPHFKANTAPAEMSSGSYDQWLGVECHFQRRRWLVWRSGRIDKVKLHRVRLVLGLVTTLGGSTITVFSRSPRSTQPSHPSWVGGDCFGHR